MIELQTRQHLLVADAAPGAVVDDLDQALDAVLAVADDVAGHPFGGGDERPVGDVRDDPMRLQLDHFPRSLFASPPHQHHPPTMLLRVLGDPVQTSAPGAVARINANGRASW